MASRTATRSRSGSAKRSTATARRKARAATRKPSTRRSGSAGTRRKAAPRASTATRRRAAARSRSRPKDAIALLKEDHREVEQMFRRYSRLGQRAVKSKTTIVRKIVEELSKHAAVEEQILYPAMRELISRSGDRMAKEGIDEHQEVKELLADLDGMSPDGDEFEPKMTSLMENVRHHVREEENEMFPALRKATGRERLVDMAQMMELAKKIAPTRPHPRAPSTPPGNVVVGAVAGIADRVRDAGRSLIKG